MTTQFTHNTVDHDVNAPLNLWQLFCYGLLSMPIAIGGFALVTYIPTFYAVDLELGLSLVGLVFVFGRLLDVITDPVIGYLSDKTQTRFGARRPWIVLGMPLFCMAAWMLFVPPTAVSLPYLIIASGAYFLFYTALDVPYSSVGLEISSDIHERSILASTKAIFQVLGALTAALVPLLFVLKTDASLSLITKLIFLISILGVFLFVVFVPKRGKSKTITQRPSFIKAGKLAWRSGPYRFMISAFCIVQTANALTAGLTVLFVTNIIKTPDLIGLFLGVLLISSALFLPVWIAISKRWTKKTAWACSIIMCCIMLSMTPFIGEGDIVPVLFFSAFIGAAFGCDAIMPTSMLADIVYKDEMDGKGRHAALYLAIKNSVSKLTFIAPMGIAFPLLDVFGFSSGSDNTLIALNMLVFFYALAPILLRLMALGIVLKMPETEKLYS